MRRKTIYPFIIVAALLSVTLFSTSAFSGEQENSFLYTRLYPDEKGISHFMEAHMDLHPYGYGMGMYYSIPIATKTIEIFYAPSDFVMGLHNAPAKQFVIVLSGTMEIESGDGEKRLFKPGNILLVEDTTGQGHKTRSVGKKELVLGWIRFNGNK